MLLIVLISASVFGCGRVKVSKYNKIAGL